MPLSKQHFQVRELVFGAHLHADVILHKPVGERFYREITKVSSRLFTTSIIQDGMPFVYLNERTRTQCVLAANSLVFTERDRLGDPERFLKDCQSLVNRFVEIFEYPRERFRLYGFASLERFIAIRSHILASSRPSKPQPQFLLGTILPTFKCVADLWKGTKISIS